MNISLMIKLLPETNGRFQRHTIMWPVRGCRRLHPRLFKSVAFSDMDASSSRGLLRCVALALLLVAVLPTCGQPNSPFSILHSQLIEVEEGDLLFVAQTEDNAITQVTQGIDNLAIDHVAIMHRIGGKGGPLYALEAIPRQGVVLTSIDSLVVREQGATFVLGHVQGVDAARSVRSALRYVGLPYDDLYLPGDSAIYCSELVQMCYVDTAGRPIFGTIPMSFHDRTGRILDHWTEFYRQRGMAVPEGLPGTNPGQLSRHPQVTIVKLQKNPEACTIQRE